MKLALCEGPVEYQIYIDTTSTSSNFRYPGSARGKKDQIGYKVLWKSGVKKI